MSANLSVFLKQNLKWLLAFIFCLYLGFIVASRQAPFFMPDEGAHYLRAYEVSHLHFFNTKVNSGIDVPCGEYVVAASKYHLIALLEKRALENSSDPDCRVNSTNTASGYSFIPYLPAAVALSVTEKMGWSVEERLVAARYANFLIWFSVICIGLMMINVGRPIFACLILMPSFFWQLVALSADGATFAFCILYTLLILRLIQKSQLLSARVIGVLILLGAGIGASKGVYAPLALLSFALWDNFPNQSITRRFFFLAAPTIVGMLIFVIFASSTDAASVFLGNSANPALQVKYIIGHPLEVIGLVFGAFTGMDLIGLVAPGYAVQSVNRSFGISVVIGIATLILLATSSFAVTPKLRIASIMVFFTLLFSVSLPLYLTYTPPGYATILGVQSRYYLPLIPLFFVAIAFNSFEVNWKKFWSNSHWIVVLPLIGLVMACFNIN
jgi:uncharacterized membrane protein